VKGEDLKPDKVSGGAAGYRMVEEQLKREKFEE